MKFLLSALLQTGRNFKHARGLQLMTLATVTLSVLIFSFFFLIYINIMQAGIKLGGDLRLVVYLEEEPLPEMLTQLKNKIAAFGETEKIIYVSCNPSILARDLQILCEDQYSPVCIQPVDMFPHTGHIEVIAVLKLNPSSASE